MNAEPARQLYSVKGGSSPGPGRPSKEKAEQRAAQAHAKRAETKAYLEKVGLFRDACNKRSKAFDTWSVKDCESALAWCAKRLAKNDSTSTDMDEDLAGAAALRERTAPEVATPFVAAEPAGVESVRAAGRVAVDTLADPLSWPTPYVHEVIAWTKVYQLEKQVKELERELSDAFGELQRLTCDHEYKATLQDILVVAGIDKGRLVRDIRRKLQQVISDAVDRDDAGYKGKVKATLSITFDKASGRPSEALAAIITCEVNEDTPPAVCGSRLYFDTKGTIIPPQEHAQHMPLMAAGGAA